MYTNPHPDEVRFEFPDPDPVEIPVEDRPTPNTLQKLMEEAHLRQALAAQLIPETFEEADDFDVVDDMPDYHSTPWEVAADAAKLTPEDLFQRVYGISREEAQARLQELVSPKDSTLTDNQEPTE